MAEGHGPFDHVVDHFEFHLPGGVHLPLPEIAGFQLTKFMVLQVVALVAALLIFRGLAKRVQTGEPAQGRFWNFWEAIALFIRDNVARPAIGTGHDHDHDDHHEEEAATDPLGHERQMHESYQGEGGAAAIAVGHPADQYLPYVWSAFFYVLFCNLLGAIPWMGTATGSISVTAALAGVTFSVVLISGIAKFGVGGYMKALIPGMDVPGPIAVFLLPLIWVIEVVGLVIKHGVLAVRLFANIMAGHTVLAVILAFIAVAADQSLWLYAVVTPASILGQVAIGLLELFVAFLQAYIFAFLSALFIGAAVNPH